MTVRAELSELGRAESLDLLGQVSVGRMVFTDGDHPTVHPVNFSLDGEDVILRTGGGGKLAAAAARGTVAFEADELDPATCAGWSVVVVGHAEVVTDIDELVALAHPDRRPWAPGRTGHVVRIRPEQITGRRLAPVPATGTGGQASPAGGSTPVGG
jgi:nitroimidazol reductase NimA-like FMN-containing flavoprotein (pyridoxamine 5'-phosphate oxidase superfamily)